MGQPYKLTKKILAGGRVSWSLDWRPIQGRNGLRVRPQLGYDLTEADARAKAEAFVRNYEREMAAPDHRREGDQPSPSRVVLADLLPLFWDTFDLAGRIDHKRPQQILDLHLLPFFKHQNVRELTYADGIAYQTLRKQQGAAMGTIQREWTVLMRILNLAVLNQALPHNPFLAVPKPQGTRRQRVASTEELKALQSHTSEELWSLILMCLTTGLRLGNIFKLQKEWVSPDGRWLMIPPARSLLKNHPQRVPLPSLAREALGVGGVGPVWSWKYIRGPIKAWSVACTRAGIHDLHLHDLRHTFATRLKGLGVGYEVRQALLGHVMKGETANYSHGSPEWDAQLCQAVEKLDVVYRREQLDVQRHRSATATKKVVGIETFKSLKGKQKRWSGKGDLNPRPSPWQGARF